MRIILLLIKISRHTVNPYLGGKISFQLQLNLSTKAMIPQSYSSENSQYFRTKHAFHID